MTNINHALSVRSDFSIGESMLQMDHIIDAAKTHGYESVALVDAMSIHGMVDFSNKCNKAGIKPIIGVQLRVYDSSTYRKPSKASGIKEEPNPFVCIKAYAIDATGTSALMKLLSDANTKEQFYYHSRTEWKDVLALEGVAISTGDMNGLFNHSEAKDILSALINKIGKDRVFVELTPIDTPLFDQLNQRALEAAKECGANTLVGYPTMYLKDEDASTLDVLGVITSQGKMSVGHRSKQYVKNFSFNAPNHLIDKVRSARTRSLTWNNVPESGALWAKGLANISKLVAMCNYRFEKMPVSLPLMAANEFEALAHKCVNGWKRRLFKPVLGYMPAPADMPIYQERLKFELSVLKKMGFSGYFLLVEDLVTWAKMNDIICGPGRGSVGGSLVAFLLGITDVDPIRFNLLFERFINPDRIDLPDADLDFMSSRRHEIIQYLIGKYGADRVAGISNYSSLASASALRDTGRVHDMSPLDLMATKLVPKDHGQSFTLTEAAKKVPELEKFKDTHTDIWNHAIKLEGCMRSFGRHAAGVVVAGEPLINRAVVESRDTEDGVPVVAWDKRVVEDFGLVKIDILGLATLDVLEIARGYIRTRHKVDVNYLDIELEEEAVMDAFGRGDTTGVFQFESGGMKSLLRNLAKGGRLTFEDIAAATALYRPGPMDSGLMEDFIQIRQGNRAESYEHENMKAALKDTYSVIVYQEQVMQVAVDLAGFTRTEADHLRKIMGKKDKDKMAEMREQWVNGCAAKSGMGSYAASDLFDKIEAFAGYGFNKSHAVEYSVISVWTMWVRCHYPAEYFAACLSVVGDDKIIGLVKDAREYEIDVLPPDINVSTDKFIILNDKQLVAPFSKVMGCSENTALRIVALRDKQGGAFTDVEHFNKVTMAVGSKVNSKIRANLDLVGALVPIQTGAKPARDLSRRKDQTILMPGLIIDAVKADRSTDTSEVFLKSKIIHIIQDYRGCSSCDLKSQLHPTVRFKSDVKFMVVFDSPNWQEEKAGRLLEGEAADFVKLAISEAGLSVANGYYTTVVKAKKNDKFLTNGQLNGCSQFLEREVELIKPAIIVTLGSAAIKRFLPSIKGSTAEMAGKTVFSPKYDATIVCGINPMQIGFDPNKLEILQATFREVADILN